jgi:predicted negative regulator of RcsB-dependent stress response
MNMTTNCLKFYGLRVCATAAFLLAAGGAQAIDVKGSLITTDEKTFTGVLKWKASSRVYVVSTGKMDLEFAPAQVKDISVPEPAGYRDAVKSVQEGRPQQAIPVLERISQEYLMLQWDEPATRALAEACLASGDAAGALRACEKVIAAKAEAGYSGEMAPLYWQALLKLGKTTKLDELLEQAIKTGVPESTAFALIMRGDILVAKGDFKGALKDGYLRVIALFRAVRTAQPEALFKAAKAFDQLNQATRAETMRKQLLLEYKDSDWARQIKGNS